MGWRTKLSRTERIRVVVVLVVFAAAFIALTVDSYTQKSATVDEPINLTAGYAALKLHDFRLDNQHPPLLRMWAALPLLTMPNLAFDTSSRSWADANGWEVSHQFLYQLNNADRLLYSARFMTVLLGIALGALLFRWAYELFGFWTATLALVLYGSEPNLIAHSSLVTTDLGVTCFFFGTLYFLWRMAGEANVRHGLGLLAFFVLAQVSKYSAILLWPIVVLLLAIPVFRCGPWRTGRGRSMSSRWSKAWFAFALLSALAIGSYVAIWASYGFRYSPTASGRDILQFTEIPALASKVPHLAAIAGWVDRHHLLPNGCSQGFFLKMAEAQQQSAFLDGQFSNTGWWYYFPFAFLIKTPISLILLCAVGVGCCVAGWKSLWTNLIFALVPVGVYMGAAMTAHTDIGLRYILPIYPFLLLLAGVAIHKAISCPRKRWLTTVVLLCLLQVGECLWIRPDYLACFNVLAGGPSHGSEYLVDSNLDWGQDLKPLKQWMREQGVDRINLSYFGTADPVYYGIQCTYICGAPFFAWGKVRSPVLPGYVAISATNLRGVYLKGPDRDFYKSFSARKPARVVGHSIYVYWVDQPWW